MRICSRSLDTGKNFNAHLLHLRYILCHHFYFPLIFPQKVFGIAFSIIGLVPSIALVSSSSSFTALFTVRPAQSCSTPFLMADRWRWSGGCVCFLPRSRHEYLLSGLQWAIASICIFVVGLSLAELASAAPTSGGVSNDGLAGQSAKPKP